MIEARVLTHFFNSFGPIAYLLMLSSIIIIAFSLERLINIYIQPHVSLKQLNPLIDLIRHNNFEQTQIYAQSLSGTLQEWINILLHYPKELAEDELNLIMSQKRRSLQQPLEWLNLFAIISPMLGLLGTIWSMSHSFSMLGGSFTGEGMGKMIVYLSEAMYATAFGIVLALISMLSLHFLRQKSEQYLAKCEMVLNRVALALAHQSLNIPHNQLKSMHHD